MKTNKQPNIIMITTDHQRADSIGMVQCGTEVTPNLNKLAESGSLFSRAYNTCPLCVPARTAMATGKYPTENGVVLNKSQSCEGHKTMHEYLYGGGYQVAHIGVNHIRVSPHLRETLPFVKWREVFDYKQYFAEQGKSGHYKLSSLGTFSKRVDEMREGNIVATSYSNSNTSVWFDEPADLFMDHYFCNEGISIIKELAERKSEEQSPWALFINLWAPHPPLVVPEEYTALFPPEQLELPSNVGIPAANEPPSRRKGVPAQLAEGVTMEEWRKTWSAHLQLTRLADDGIGRVLDALEQSGMADDTVVLFTSDHGDHLGQHSMYQKMEMYEQAIRVPLIIRTPGTQVIVVDQPVSHLDVLPTLLTYAGITVPKVMDGVPLQDYMHETSGITGADRAVFSQYSGNPAIGDIRRAIITKYFKYVYSPNYETELFDLHTDPMEMTNLAEQQDYEAIKLELHSKLEVWGKAHKDWIDYDL